MTKLSKLEQQYAELQKAVESIKDFSCGCYLKLQSALTCGCPLPGHYLSCIQKHCSNPKHYQPCDCES